MGMRQRGQLLIIAVILVATLAMGGNMVSAHARLKTSDPADKATLTKAPDADCDHLFGGDGPAQEWRLSNGCQRGDGFYRLQGGPESAHEYDDRPEAEPPERRVYRQVELVHR